MPPFEPNVADLLIEISEKMDRTNCLLERLVELQGENRVKPKHKPARSPQRLMPILKPIPFGGDKPGC